MIISKLDNGEFIAGFEQYISRGKFQQITKRDITDKSVDEIILVLQDLFQFSGDKFDFNKEKKIVTQLVQEMKKGGFDFLSEENEVRRKQLAELIGLSINQSARFEMMFGNYDNAEKMLQKSLDTQEGINELDILYTKLRLAITYTRQNKFTEAEKLFLQIIDETENDTIKVKATYMLALNYQYGKPKKEFDARKLYCSILNDKYADKKIKRRSQKHNDILDVFDSEQELQDHFMDELYR